MIELKKRLLNNLLDIINEFSSKEYQIRIWVKGLGPECTDYDETLDFFFTDGVPIIDNYKAYGITQNQYELLRIFQQALEEFSDKNFIPLKFIDTPEWQHIIDKAKQVLEAFDYKKL